MGVRSDFIYFHNAIYEVSDRALFNHFVHVQRFVRDVNFSSFIQSFFKILIF